MRYGAPASDWQSQALPIGNGRLGAMLFGGIGSDTVQLNESSLYAGSTYQNFGSFTVDFLNSFLVSNPENYPAPSSEVVNNSVDNDLNSKWCIGWPAITQPITWLVSFNLPTIINAYSITSAEDVPERDPSTWQLFGSNDNSSWTILDSRNNVNFKDRHLNLRFTFTNTTPYTYYKILFQVPSASNGQFQLAAISMDGPNGNIIPGQNLPTNYQRQLDLVNGLHTITYTKNGVNFQRVAFASFPDQVMVFHYTADKANSLNGTISLSSAQNLVTRNHLNNSLVFNNTTHAACLLATNEAGTLIPDSSGTKLEFAGCNSLTLLVDMRTNYAPVYFGVKDSRNWVTKKDPLLDLVLPNIATASTKSIDELISAHTVDFAALMNRVNVDWGSTKDAIAQQNTDDRVVNYQSHYEEDNADPELEQTMFYYSRYLVASSMRPGGLPANLQGIWNNSNSPAWGGNLFFDLNLFECHWSVESTALPECHQPLIDWAQSIRAPLHDFAKSLYGNSIRGWSAIVSQGIRAETNSGTYNKVFDIGNAWVCSHLYEHYAFTQNSDYLRNQAYPILIETSQFWQDRLPDGGTKANTYAPDSWSPEQGPGYPGWGDSDGAMFYQQLLWDLFHHTRKASEVLQINDSFINDIATMQNNLAPNIIGSWGQLQEFRHEVSNIDASADKASHHRHTSHLWAVYPGTQITPSSTPELAAAALVSLRSRFGLTKPNDVLQAKNANNYYWVSSEGYDGPIQSWTWTWRCGLFARLAKGAEALEMVRGLLGRSTYGNLFSHMHSRVNGGVFQAEGMMGVAGSMAEMLLQSHEGRIALCPALPPSWASGSFSGLRARGGYRVDCQWENGTVTSYKIVADFAPNLNPVTVRVNGQDVQVVPQSEQANPQSGNACANQSS